VDKDTWMAILKMGYDEEVTKLRNEFLAAYPVLANPARKEMLEEALFCYYMAQNIRKQVITVVDNGQPTPTRLTKEYREFLKEYRNICEKLGLVAQKYERKGRHAEGGVLAPSELLKRLNPKLVKKKEES